MLQNIRDKSQGWITWVIVVVICFSFAIWGIHNYMGSGSTAEVVAEINGEPIYQSELMHLQRNAIETMQSNQGQQFEISETLSEKIKKQTLLQLINNQLALQGAIKQRFTAPSALVYDLIMQMPSLQENGQFSSQRFMQALRMMNETEQQYFNRVKGAIIIEQARLGITNSDFILPAELNTLLSIQEQKRNIAYLIIPTSRFDNIATPETELQQYYDTNKENFKTAEQISLSYIELSRENVAKALNLTENDSNVDKEFANKSEELANKSYEEPNSLDPAAKALGITVKQTGLFQRNGKNSGVAADPLVLTAAFSDEVLNNGYNSDVITLNDGTQLVVRVDKHIPERTQTFAEARTEIEKALKQQQKDKEVQALSASILKQIQIEGKDPKQVASQLGLQWITKENVTRFSTDLDSPILNHAFKLALPSKKASIGDVALSSHDYAIVMVTKVIPADPTKIDKTQYDTYRAQFAERNGLFVYDLYMKSLKDNAKIKLTDNAS